MNAQVAAHTGSVPEPGLEYRVLGLLAELSQSLAVSLDIDRTLARAVQRIAECMNAEAASLFLLDAEGTLLVCRACHGPVMPGRTLSRRR